MESSMMHQLIFMLIISSTICLSIATPSFDVHPIDAEVSEGGLAILRCTVTDLGDASLYWRYVSDGGSIGILSVNRNTEKYAPLHGELTERLSVKGDPNHGEYNLFIKNVIMSDQRQYFCSAITAESYVFDSSKASLIVRPRNRPIPDELDPLPACLAEAIAPPGIFNIGSLVRFTCATASGSPPQTLAWTIIEGGRRTLLVACPQSPCIHNRQLSIEDVNRTFVCELVDGSAHPNRVECTYTPLQRQIDVVIDPPLFQHPPGIRQGFICFPVAYDPNNLLFEWYRNTDLIANGTSYSLLNLMIHREDDGSTLSCVVSTLDGSFRGIGKAYIELFDPSEVFPDAEGSSSPSLDHVTTRRAKTETSSSRSGSVIKYTTTLPSAAGPLLSIQPLAEISDGDNSSKHLSILVVVSAIAGALVTMLSCAIGLVVLLFIRKRRKQILKLQQNGATHGNGNCGQLEMSVVDTKTAEGCVAGEIGDNAVNAQRQSMGSDTECTLDRFYVTLEPEENEAAEDIDYSKKASKDSPDAEKSPAFGPPCTPNEYARPQTKPLEISDQLHQGMLNQGLSRIHERTMSESSASAYAVTDVVSLEGRFIFKGMSGRDEAHMGVCRVPSGERSATMSRALTRNQTAPPLPARTLPRTLSVQDQPPCDESFSQRRQSDSEAIKDKAKSKSKNSFGNRWPWSVRNKKECSLDSEVTPATPDVPSSEWESRRLSVASGGSGDYAEIISADKVTDSTPGKRHSIACEKLDSIPERSVPANDYQDVEAYASSMAFLDNQPKIGKETTTESGYDRLSRPNQFQSPPLQRSRTMPIYAKVKKSKSLDHDGSGKTTNETGQGDTRRNRTDKSESNPKLLRSMSEGTAPSARKNKPRVIGGYDTVEITEKLDHILVQMRNGFSGETIDISDEELKEPSTNKGTHFADIV